MCPPDDELMAYARDPLGHPSRREIANHLDECCDCDEKVQAWEDEQDDGPSPYLIQQAMLLASPSTPVSPEQVPAIDGYEILGVIGQGGMGVVYKAWHPTYGIVALKVLLRDALATADDIRQAHREASEAKAAWDQAVASGDPSPPFVRVHQVSECRGVHYISMELAAAGKLADRLADLVKAPRKAAEFLRSSALAAHAMHVRGVIHRDLKPANILLRPKPGRPVSDDPAQRAARRPGGRDLRLRAGQARGHGREHSRGRAQGLAALHGPRIVPPRVGRGQRGHRRVCARRGPLRGAHAVAPLPQGHAF